MAANSSANPALAFVAGALIVVVAGLGWFVYTGDTPSRDEPEIQIDLPGKNSN